MNAIFQGIYYKSTDACKMDLFQYILSPSLSLFLSGPARPEGEANVLLVGSGDPRHILKSIAGLQDKENLHVRLDFKNIVVPRLCKAFGTLCAKTCSVLQVWVVESSMEVVARQLLLLYLALMPQQSMGNNGTLAAFLRVHHLDQSSV